MFTRWQRQCRNGMNDKTTVCEFCPDVETCIYAILEVLQECTITVVINSAYLKWPPNLLLHQTAINKCSISGILSKTKQCQPSYTIWVLFFNMGIKIWQSIPYLFCIMPLSWDILDDNIIFHSDTLMNISLLKNHKKTVRSRNMSLVHHMSYRFSNELFSMPNLS